MLLSEKSLNTIELPAVLQLLAAEASSETAKELAIKLLPSVNIYEVRRDQSETSAAKTMMATKGSPAFSGTKDVSGSIRRADMGGMLNTSELLDIAAILRNVTAAISYASGDRTEKTAIDYLFLALSANKYLENKISTSIIGVDEIADAASSELATIRRHMRLAGEKVRQSLNKIITSPAYSKALQEPIITMRNDRYVVPVKAEHKGSVPGLVHDISSSGATLFIEPISAVQANNEIRELLAKEKKEIERILMELSADVSQFGEDIIENTKTLTSLDFIFAKAKLSYKLNAGEPDLDEAGKLVLKKARHPLLPEKTAVPIDVRLGEDFDTLVITGPNTGGKTVTLKTMGLFCAMAQCGLHIPAGDGSCVPVYSKILADIGDEQSIEQSLSTFSSHMTNIVKILDECGENTLVLFDELGAGTDPVEGAALAISIIEHARQKGAYIAATTHYAELKAYATTTENVQNASCEFDVETLRPTYRLLIGIPGKSNAFAISSRLGLSDDVISDAKARVDTESISFEAVLENLEQTRQQLEKEQLETRKLLRETQDNAKQTEKQKRETEHMRNQATRAARHEADRILEEARAAAESVFEEIKELRKIATKEKNWQQINDAKSEMFRRLNQQQDAYEIEEEALPQPSSRPVQAGDRVRLLRFGTLADVISVAQDGTLSLQAGIMKITANANEVQLVEGEAKESIKRQIEKSEAKLRNMSVKPEVDLRGMMTDEAILIMERYLDSAQMAKLNNVTVIHGKGTGALRNAVHQSLKRNRQVKSYRLGRYGEGEDGVTIVEIK